MKFLVMCRLELARLSAEVRTVTRMPRVRPAAFSHYEIRPLADMAAAPLGVEER